ncbi:MAG: phosphopantothenoylcysteine decarboxylase [Verrucomicrobiota bacterium]|jgi:phosphopantothenoylcysteine decarboxylase/phosphopantothenate--cysteine ligase
MNCLVTAGPTVEPLDQVRRLTNFSTGRLGGELADHLVARGHHVTLLLAESATWPGSSRAHTVERFSTTADLRARMFRLAGGVDAVFHAAAVSDFAFGQVWRRLPAGELELVKAGKLTTRAGTLLTELTPTPKIIGELRDAFPGALLVGWKFEVDGGRLGALAASARQLRECRTNACVLNGPAYGPGFALCVASGIAADLPDRLALFAALEVLLDTRKA